MSHKNRSKRSQQKGSPKIVATSQMSRFHSETLETLSSDVDLKGVNITIGDLNILSDAHLQPFQGVHYGLIGANGIGKTTLLKRIGYKKLVGFPANVRVLYVEQLEGRDTSQRVIDMVLSRDERRQKLLSRSERLQLALESNELTDLSLALKSSTLEDQQQRLDALIERASKLSGARGATARIRLNEAEDTFDKLKKTEYDNSHEKVMQVLNEINEELNYDSAESDGRKILSGLGFSPEMQDRAVSEFSGGWKIRIALASVLLIAPDILILDEPTNHLDLPAILWLQTYISTLEIPL